MVKRVIVLLKMVMGFAAVSGVGLFLDFTVFFIAIGWGASPTIANLVSATVAVAFVYFASVRRVFSYQGRFLFLLLSLYLVYQAIAVSAASLAVGYLAVRLHSAGAAKLAILPVTFASNFFFMWLLTGRRLPPKERLYGG